MKRLNVISSNVLVPKFLFMEVNQRCNLRCNHCDFWKRNDDNKKYYLSKIQKTEILQDFSELNPKGNLVICGGEPMLDIDEYMFMCTTAHSLGLRVLSVVNGTRIFNEKIAEDILLNGPDEISISFDDYRPGIHDELRGVKNSFKLASNAIRLLLEVRSKMNLKNKIYVMGLVHSKNYLHLDSFYNFVLNELGADKLKLNIIQPTFGSDVKDDYVFKELVSGVDYTKVRSILSNCNDKYELGLNEKFIDAVEMYFRSFNKGLDNLEGGWHEGLRTEEAICNSYERNIMIDHYGFAKLCFATCFGGAPVSQRGDLKEFWNNSNNIRNNMAGCKIPCGISHSVRAFSATIGNKML